MRNVLVGGLLVSLAQVVRGEVGLMYKLSTADDVETSLDVLDKIVRAGKFVRAVNIDGEITVIAGFATVGEAEAFL